VIPEHGVARREPFEERPQPRFTPWPRDEVTADQRQIRPPAYSPFDRALDCSLAARRKPEVEVGQVSDPQADELVR
jgi:hypothetical protein